MRGDLEQINLAEGQRAPLLEVRREVRAHEVLHHHVGRAVLQLAHVDHPRDVVALEARRRARLAQEALHHLAARAGEEELDGHLLPQRDVRRRHDHAHAALPEHALDAVLAGEDLPLGDRRSRRLGLLVHARAQGVLSRRITAPLGASEAPSLTQ